MVTMRSRVPVNESLQDLRELFQRYGIEDWEPIPGEKDWSYSIRYRQSGRWVLVSSGMQPTKAQNLRQCYQVIQYLFLWASRGVSGVAQGVTFIQGGLVPIDAKDPGTDVLEEAYATIGVEASVTMEEVRGVYYAKLKHSHPDLAGDPGDRETMEARTKRLNLAFEMIEKARNRTS